MSHTPLEARIDNGRKALALAREKGLDTAPWETELANLEQKLAEAEHTVNRTCQLLDTRGWCKWQCEALGDDIVVIARDDKVTGLPDGLVVYTMQEFQHLFGGSKPISRSTPRLAHEAKKLFTATVLSVVASRSHPPTGDPEPDKPCRSHPPTGDPELGNQPQPEVSKARRSHPPTGGPQPDNQPQPEVSKACRSHPPTGDLP